MGKSSGQGGGTARSAKREDTAPQHFTVAVGDRPSPTSLFIFWVVQRRLARVRTARRATAIVTRMAGRQGPGRPWPKVRALARRDRARAMRTERMGRVVTGGSWSSGSSLKCGDTPRGCGRGYDRRHFHEPQVVFINQISKVLSLSQRVKCAVKSSHSCIFIFR